MTFKILIEEVIIAALCYVLAGYFSMASANKMQDSELADEGSLFMAWAIYWRCSFCHYSPPDPTIISIKQNANSLFMVFE